MQEKTWEVTKQRLQARWPALSEADLEPTQGRREDLVALLEGRLGYPQANAERDVDHFFAGESIVPKDVADENVHTGTSGPSHYRNSDTSSADAFRTADPAYGQPAGTSSYSYGQSAERSPEAGRQPGSGGWLIGAMALHWRTTALVAAAATGSLALASVVLASRRSHRKQIVIPLPTQAESVQALEAAGRTAGAGWRFLRSGAVLVVGALVGWGVRRYQAM